MTQKLMLTTALSVLMLTAAVAQTPAPEMNTPPANTPAQSTESAPNQQSTAPNATREPNAKGDSLRSQTQAAPDREKAAFLPEQGTDRWVFSKFSGIDVIGTDDKKIGDVSDLVFDKNHMIIAYVVGVGGFLGLGEKNVAIEPAAFKVWRDPKETRNDPSVIKLKVSWTGLHPVSLTRT